MTPQEIEKSLKRFWKVEKLEFIAQYALPNQRNGNIRIGYFNNLRANDCTIIYPEIDGLNYERRVSVQVTHHDNFVNGEHYLITVKPSSNNQSANPYFLELDEVFEIEGYDTPKEFIGKWFFRKGENPGDAATIASQLKLNQLELYTQTERFIFELLQNADDMPAADGKTVEVFMEMLPNYFLFLHNGKFFDREDVKAIADAAQSTKSKDKTQTGYKGIGFKSVFTDSSRVYIKSRDYTFKFDKLNPVYSDFWKLYSGYLGRLTLDAQKQFEREYKGQETKYTQIERIPWQIKPIWVEYSAFPEELRQSEFSKRQNVAIALEIGAATFTEKEYHRKVLNLLQEPRFLLFLRNLSGLTFKSGEVSRELRINRTKNNLEITVNGQIHSKYLRSDYEITISSESFKEAGLHFDRREIEDGKYEFVDDQGKKIENIPEKLAILDKTALTFAAQIKDNKIAKLPKDEAILFNYLPTSDKRFEFPFLVNGDFVTKTDREFILHENVWNQYLFFHIGFYHILWLSHVSGIRQFLPSYLNLLIPKLKDESDQQEGKINAAFNRGVGKALTEVAFIRNEFGNLSKSADLILDETGLSKILGFRFFRSFTGTSKCLPDLEINEDALRKGFLEIERFHVEQLCQLLANEEKKSIWISAIQSLDNQSYISFLEWLNELCSEHQVLISGLASIPFLRFFSGVFSPAVALGASDKIVANEKMTGVRDTLSVLGFEVTDFSIDKFTNLNGNIANLNNYLANELRLYEKIITGNLDAGLTGAQKAELIVFFSGLFGVGEDRYANNLALFKDRDSVRRPLTKLVSGKVRLPDELMSFQINEKEEQALGLSFSKHLLQNENLFSRMFLDKTFYNEVSGKIGLQNLPTFTNFIIGTSDNDTTPGKDSQTTLNSIPWVFTDDLGRFKTATEVFCPPALHDLDEKKYRHLKSVIEEITGLVLPYYTSIQLIKKFGLNCKRGSIANEIKHNTVLSLEQANDLLDLLLKNDAKEPLFQNWQFVPNEIGTIELQPNSGKRQFYNYDTFVAEYNDRPDLKAILALLPPELYQESLDGLGLLEGEALFSYIISKGLIWLDLAQYQAVTGFSENKILFLNRLPLLELDTDCIYEKTSSEHKVIQIALDIVDQEPELIKSFREKIRLNGEPLTSNAISDEVKIKIDDFEYELSLSEILPAYKGKSDITTAAVKSFPDLKESDLRKNIFPYHLKSYASIEAEIRASNPDFITPAQIIFLLLYGRVNNKVDVFDGLEMYDVYYKDKNKTELVKGDLEFLNLAYRIQLPNWQSGFWFLDFIPENVIIESENVLASEQLPVWVQQWVSSENATRRLVFLKKAGVNDSSSPISQFRNALLNKDLASARGWLFQINNEMLLQNTLEWLFQMEDDDLTSAILDVISDMLEKIKDADIDNWVIPVIKSLEDGQRLYTLSQVPSEIELYQYQTSWGEETGHIMDFLCKESTLVVDESLPHVLHGKFSIQVKQCSKVLDEERLISAVPYGANYYLTWVEKDKYPILIYSDDALPWIVYLGEKEVRRFKQDVCIAASGKYYVCQQKESDLPYGLPHDFPSDKFRVLAELCRHQSLSGVEVEEVAPTTHQLYRSVIKGRLDMEIESQVVYNRFAIQNGVVYLNENGYNFDNAFLDNWGYLGGVVHIQTNKTYRFFFRSAMGGLLFLHPGFWNELGETQNGVITGLVVIYPGSRPQVFLSKDDLLQQEFNEMILVRTPNRGNLHEINRITEDLPAGSHLIFFTSERYKSLYEESADRSKNDPVSNRATASAADFLRNS